MRRIDLAAARCLPQLVFQVFVAPMHGLEARLQDSLVRQYLALHGLVKRLPRLCLLLDLLPHRCLKLLPRLPQDVRMLRANAPQLRLERQQRLFHLCHELTTCQGLAVQLQRELLEALFELCALAALSAPQHFHVVLLRAKARDDRALKLLADALKGAQLLLVLGNVCVGRVDPLVKELPSSLPLRRLPVECVPQLGQLLLVRLQVAGSLVDEPRHSLLVVFQVPHGQIVASLSCTGLLVDVLAQSLELRREAVDGSVQVSQLLLDGRHVLAPLVNHLLVRLLLGRELCVNPPVACLALPRFALQFCLQPLDFALQVILHRDTFVTLLIDAPVLFSELAAKLGDCHLRRALALLKAELQRGQVTCESPQLLADELPLRRHVLSLPLTQRLKLYVPRCVLLHSPCARQIWLLFALQLLIARQVTQNALLGSCALRAHWVQHVEVQAGGGKDENATVGT
mmetsp:Transcript_77722/g.180307  ORF Transcript_77722/g.180307 Transcript_77722/m.180307 type:complete len:457 (-) Transcript_77722:8-1378(-)